MIGFRPHINDMDKPRTQFESIQLKDDSNWHVQITLAHGVQQRISYFSTEAEARMWIDENSALWLMTYSGRTYVQGPPIA